MPNFGWLPRLGLLARFSVLSFVAFVLIGVVLGRTLTDQIRERSLVAAGESAELVTHFGIQPQLSAYDVREGLAPEAVDSLDRLLHAGYTSDSVLTIRIWNREDRVVYSDERSVIGSVEPAEHGLTEAIAGRTSVREVADEQEDGAAGHGRSLEAYVPLRFEGENRPAGAFEVHLKYGPVDAAIKRDTRRLYAVLVLGLLVLYGALFRIVAGASRRLRRQAAENEYQAHHDTLTGLPNRSSFYDRVDRAISRARLDSEMAAVMIVDLDRFKEVNDTLGHHSGDILLKQAAERLHAALRPSDALARLGGDEFAVLLPSLPSHDVAVSVAGRIRDALERPFVLHGLTVHIDASTGIAVFPEHGDDVESLIQRADIAMYAAKRSSLNFEIYAPEEDEHTPGRLQMLGELRQAIDNDAFILHYQPKASLRTGAVEGVEALVRWEHPERGIVPPNDFIPLAEQTGLIKPLTAWVLDAALGQCRRWRDEGIELSIAVNLSVRNLLDTHLPDSIGSLLQKWELPPSALQLEITEGTIVTDQVRALDVLGRLDGMGIGLAIDDFGTGYSSLAYLKDLPVRELKIDRTFVNNMNEDGSDAFIVRSTIDLARNLGLQVVAEGVENEATLDQLAALGCDLAQGYYLSRPLPAAELAEWLRVRRAGNAAIAQNQT
jgi:diguanylate cyclase (GGDEF)-like protein